MSLTIMSSGHSEGFCHLWGRAGLHGGRSGSWHGIAHVVRRLDRDL